MASASPGSPLAHAALVAAPTFSPAGLYFLGPLYDAGWGLPPEATLQAERAAYDGPP